jgi:hypothetical protein
MKPLVNIAAAAFVALALAACPGGDKHDHDHDHAGDHDHDHGVAKPGDGGHSHGEAKPLGEQTAGGFTVSATREGALAAAGETSIRVKFSGGSGKIAAVRLWIGSEDGKGALKAKADLEGDAWHAHAETPAALYGARLWVEFETDAGAKSTAGFDLVN